MKIPKKYLPFALAGLVGAGIYDGAKTLFTTALQTESMQRVIGNFRSYDPSEVNPETCNISYFGEIHWSNTHVRFWEEDNYPNSSERRPHFSSINNRFDRRVDRGVVHYKDEKKVLERGIDFEGAPTEAYKDSELASTLAHIYVTMNFRHTPDGRCEPKAVRLLEDSVSQGDVETKFEVDHASLTKLVSPEKAGKHNYKVALTYKSGVEQEISLGHIEFTGKPVDMKPEAELYISYPRDKGRVFVYAADYFENKGIRDVTLTEHGKPVELRLLVFDKGEKRNDWITDKSFSHTLQPGIHPLELKVTDKRGNTTTVNKIFNARAVDGDLEVTEIKP